MTDGRGQTAKNLQLRIVIFVGQDLSGELQSCDTKAIGGTFRPQDDLLSQAR